MLLAEYIKDKYSNELNPLAGMLHLTENSEYYHKIYAENSTFKDKAIIFANIIEREDLPFFPVYTNARAGRVIFFSFEFSKMNLKTQNTFMVREGSDIYNIFNSINPAKTKRLQKAESVFNDNMLSGIHLTGVSIPILSIRRYNELEYRKVNGYLSKLIKESIDNETYKIELNGMTVYTYPIIKNVNNKDVEFRLQYRETRDGTRRVMCLNVED